MSQLEFADELLARISPRAGRFHPRAFFFVLAALERHQQRLPERRHVSGGELAHACRELALEQYGLLARTVLDHWGIRTTADIGEIVYALIDAGLLIRQPDDRPEDFEGVYHFDRAFEQRLVGRDAELSIASTDANVPISLGIPAIAIGAGGRGGDAHSTTEWFENADGTLGVARALTILMTATQLAAD